MTKNKSCEAKGTTTLLCFAILAWLSAMLVTWRSTGGIFALDSVAMDSLRSCSTRSAADEAEEEKRVEERSTDCSHSPAVAYITDEMVSRLLASDSVARRG